MRSMFVMGVFLFLAGPRFSDAADAASAPPVVDEAIGVTLQAAFSNHTYWAGTPQPFCTTLSNREPVSIKGTIVLALTNYLTRQAAGEFKQAFKLGTGEAKQVEWRLAGLEPGLYKADVFVERKGDRRHAAGTRIMFNAGALEPAPKPDDFDAFWAKTLEEQAKIPVDLRLTKVREVGKCDLYKFSFAGLLGYRCHGWLSVPRDSSKRYPAVLVLPSSGLRSFDPPRFGDERVAMVISINGVDVDLPPEQYDTRTWPAPYLVTGIMEKEYYSLRYSYAALVRAAEVLAARPEVDPDAMLVTGSSQGGGLTLVAAGLYHRFKAAVANVPALCRLDWNFDYIHPAYFPIAATDDMRPKILETLKYYDATQFARRITCPIWISVGLLDDVTPAMNVFCAYNVIPGKKQLLVQPAAGHSGGYGAVEATAGVWP
jgi:cephalosporin-C deacetylase-like acetyl esterase